jgi:hypothetical protein
MTKVVLPERDDMLARLKSVIDEPHAEHGLYPKILEHAGQTKEAPGVVLMLLLAIGDYTAGMPSVLARTLDLALPRFIAAIIDDEDARQEALAFWAEAGQ